MTQKILSTNRRILSGLLSIYSRAIKLEFKLTMDGNDKKVAQISKGINELEILIRKLRAKVLDDWAAEVPNLKKKLTKMNFDVNELLNDIEDDISKARKITSFIGKIDKAVKLFAPLLAP